MSRFVLALCLALAPLAAAAQGASDAQTTAVSSVAECLAGGLPEKWKRLQVIIELPKPLAETGGVLYLVTLPDDRTEPFKPCDPRLPPVRLLDLREIQPEAVDIIPKAVAAKYKVFPYRVRGKTPSVCRARVRTILHGHRYDGSRATRELGLEYTPVAETFARTIKWAVAEGLVTRPLPGAQPAAA